MKYKNITNPKARKRGKKEQEASETKGRKK